MGMVKMDGTENKAYPAYKERKRNQADGNGCIVAVGECNDYKRSSGKDRTWNPAYSGNAAPGNKKCIRDYL